MKTLKRYLDETKRKYGLTRNDELAQKLSVPHNHVSHWYHGTCYPGDEGMVKLARLLKVDPLEIIACVNYHKAASSIRRQLYPTRNGALRKFWWQVYDQAVRKR